MISAALLGLLLLTVLPWSSAVSDVEVVGSYPSTQPNGPASGSCGYGDVSSGWPNGFVASFKSSAAVVTSLPLSGCGACFTLTCASSSACTGAQPVTVTVIDSSPGSSFSVTHSVFAQLAPNAAGSVAATIELVDCNPPGNIELVILQYRSSGGGYLKLSIFAARGTAIKSVDLRTTGASESTWQPMTNTYGAVFELSNLPALPIDLRISNAAGQQVVATSAITSSTPPSGNVALSTQFPASGGISNATTAAAPSGRAASQSPPPLSLMPVTLPVTMPVTPPPPINIPPNTPPNQPPVTPVLPPMIEPEATPSGAPSAAPTGTPLAQPPPLPPAGATSQSPPPSSPPPIPPAAPQVAGPPPGLASPPAVVTPPPAASPPVVSSSAPGPGGCEAVWDVLQTRSALSSWVSLIQSNNQASALQNPTIKLTMLAPINSAFEGNLPAGSSLGSGSIQNLLNTNQDVRSAVIGYHIAAIAQPTSGFHVGQNITTTASLNTGTGGSRALNITVAATSPMVKLQGIASSANVLLPDVPACGPSLVNTIDTILLPA